MSSSRSSTQPKQSPSNSPANATIAIQAAAWQEQANRLQRASSFFEFIDCLFGIWSLMTEEAKMLAQDKNHLYQNNFKLLFAEDNWNQRTAFRNYLTLLHQLLQKHAVNPSRTLLPPEKTQGYPADEVAVIKAIQELVPNNIQAFLIDRLARQLLCVYWAKLAIESPLAVPGLLGTAFGNPAMFFYEPKQIRKSVIEYLALQKKGIRQVNSFYSDVLGCKIGRNVLIFDLVFGKMTEVYLAISGINSNNSSRNLATAKKNLDWLISFLGNADGGIGILANKPTKRDSLTSVLKQIRCYCATNTLMPMQMALVPNAFIVPERKKSILLTFPPWGSFWSNNTGHPFLSLIDDKIARHVLTENIDFKKTIFYQQCQLLRDNLQTFDPRSPSFRLLKTSSATLMQFNRLNAASNNACTAGACSFFALTVVALSGEDRKLIEIIVGTLAASSAELLPDIIKKLSASLSRASRNLGDTQTKAEITSQHIEQVIEKALAGKQGA